jgi:hypothetical protein
MKIHDSKVREEERFHLAVDFAAGESYTHLSVFLKRVLCPKHFVRHWWNPPKGPTKVVVCLDWNDPCEECTARGFIRSTGFMRVNILDPEKAYIPSSGISA